MRFAVAAVLFLSAAHLAVAAPAHNEELPTLALFDVRTGDGVDGSTTSSVRELVLVALQHSGRFRVVSNEDLKALLGLEAKRQLVGGDGSGAAQKVASVLGAKYLGAVDVTRLGETQLLFVKVLDVQQAVVVARAQAEWKATEQLPQSVQQVVSTLLHDWNGTQGLAPAVPTGYTPSDAASQAYQEARQAERDGLPPDDLYRKAVEMDPAFALPSLRLAIGARDYNLTEAQEAYQRAALHRSQLAPADLALLDVVEPFLRDPIDAKEMETRAVAAVESFPDNATLLLQLGRARHLQGHYEEAIEAYRSAEQADPAESRAMHAQIQALFVLNRIPEAMVLADRCILAAPFAVNCRRERVRILVMRGEWAEAEQEARRMIAAAPKSPANYVHLATAQAALGAAPATIALTLKRRLPFQKDPAKAEGWDKARVALLQGDFKAAAVELGKLLDAAGQGAELADFMNIANFLAAAYDESGQKPALLALTKKIRETADAMTPNSLTWSGDDARWLTALMEYRHGKATAADLTKARDAAWKVNIGGNESAFSKAMAWGYLFADWTQSRVEAQQALDRLTALGIDPGGAQSVVTNCPLGHVYLLAGRATDAIPLLESCDRTRSPFSNVFSAMAARADLAKAYLGAGLTDQARTACQSVVDRWGQAKPASKTAQECRALLAKLPKPARPHK